MYMVIPLQHISNRVYYDKLGHWYNKMYMPLYDNGSTGSDANIVRVSLASNSIETRNPNFSGTTK